MLKKFKHGARVTALVLGLATSIGLAFFVGSFLADGTHSGTIGSGGTGTKTLPISLNFPDAQLTPTKRVEVTANINNTASQEVEFTKISVKATPQAVGCDASWFSITARDEAGALSSAWNNALTSGTAGAGMLAYPPGESRLVTSGSVHLWLEMKDTGTDQSACESTSITVTGKLS